MQGVFALEQANIPCARFSHFTRFTLFLLQMVEQARHAAFAWPLLVKRIKMRQELFPDELRGELCGALSYCGPAGRTQSDCGTANKRVRWTAEALSACAGHSIGRD